MVSKKAALLSPGLDNVRDMTPFSLAMSFPTNPKETILFFCPCSSVVARSPQSRAGGLGHDVPSSVGYRLIFPNSPAKNPLFGVDNNLSSF
jgi:hypothetical protein